MIHFPTVPFIRTMNQSTQSRKDIYERRYEDGAWIYSLIDYQKKLTTNERLRITHTAPAALSEFRYHTAEELEKAGYHFMKGGEKHLFEAHHPNKPPSRFANHLRLSERELAQCGLLGDVGELRQRVLDPHFENGLAATMKQKYRDYSVRKGKQYELGVMRQPGYGARKLQLAEVLRSDADGSKKNFFHLARTLGQKLLDIWIPEYKNAYLFQAVEWHRNAAMTFGAESETTLNSIQLNYTKQGTALADSLKAKAHLHCDKDDQPTSYSVVFFMSNFDDCWHYGAGSGPYPLWIGPGHPLRLPGPSVQLPTLSLCAADNKMRCNLIVYPTRRLLNPTFKEANIELLQSKGLHVFTSIQTHQEWKLRMFIKEEVLIKIIGSLQINELLQKGFPEWIRNWWWMMTFDPNMFWHGARGLSDDAEKSTRAYFNHLENNTRDNSAQNNNEQNANQISQSTGQKKSYWPPEAERIITRQFTANYEDLAKKWEFLRTTNPGWFIEKFWWIDPATGVKTYPSRAMAVKTMATISAGPSEQLVELEKDIEQAYDGFRDNNGEPAFTEQESPHRFDPAVDTVPTNPDWVPSPDWEAVGVESTLDE
ncbi:hypothetical protein EYC80_008514 [Monilinia laxa]|uniref:Uncharacterized protein n=1 Tax=Monilinia laxa TaxID=61186 RepID=A0A5N6JS84_MONLA|nr:hypothetical protein EYC80_008514 [Monilinia laxa]